MIKSAEIQRPYPLGHGGRRNKNIRNTRKNVEKLIAVYLQNTHISVAINLRLFILVQKRGLDYVVLYITKFATLGQSEAKI